MRVGFAELFQFCAELLNSGGSRRYLFVQFAKRNIEDYMAAQSEVEELQLKLESKICSLDLNGLVELAAHLNVEFKELGKLARSKKIREEVENSLTETEDNRMIGMTRNEWDN